MMRTIVEDLNYASQEPSSQAAQQAKQLGLMYVGFGRYEDPNTRQVTHVVQNDRLVPFRKAIKTNTYRSSGADDIGKLTATLSADVQKTNDTLVSSYGPENYDEKELAAIDQFVNQSYSDVNERLAKLPVGISSSNIQPQSMNDTTPDVIAALDSVMKKVRAPVDFIVYTKLEGVDRLKVTAGKKFKFKGFKNTTLNLSSVIEPDDTEVDVLQIRVRKNNKGFYAAEYSQTPEEGEFILPRGAKIEVLSGPNKIVGSDAVSGINKEIYYYDCQIKS